jgi:ketosteroid isomerase-like protein
MSKQNVEIVNAAFDAYFRGDMDSALRFVDPEIVVLQRPELPDAMPRRGHAGVVEAISMWPDQWDDYQLEVVETLDAGDYVIVKSHHRGRGKGSGIDVEDEIWYVFGFRDAKVAEWRMFGTEREALEAAGRSG